MKICHVSSCFPPSKGGVETFVYTVCKRLVEKGHQVKVITSNRGKPIEEYREWVDGIEVIRYPERLLIFEAPIVPQIALRLMREDYDVLHIHGMAPPVTDLALVIGKLKRKPLLLTYHCDAETFQRNLLGRIINKLYNALAPLTVRLADQIVASTRSYAETSPVLSKLPDKVAIIPMGTDTSWFRKGNNPPTPAKGSYRILFVGKLHPYKGVENLIHAIKIVSGFMNNVHLTIIGDGNKREELVSLTKKLGLEDQVAFTGWVSDEELLRHYQTADLFVLPSILSRREAFGIVLLEAMACGIPVIASDIPGPNEVVKNEESGLLVPPEDAQKLAEAIVALLRSNSQRIQMGAYARKLVEKRYAWTRIVNTYEGLYKNIGGRVISHK